MHILLRSLCSLIGLIHILFSTYVFALPPPLRKADLKDDGGPRWCPKNDLTCHGDPGPRIWTSKAHGLCPFTYPACLWNWKEAKTVRITTDLTTVDQKLGNLEDKLDGMESDLATFRFRIKKEELEKMRRLIAWHDQDDKIAAIREELDKELLRDEKEAKQSERALKRAEKVLEEKQTNYIKQLKTIDKMKKWYDKYSDLYRKKAPKIDGEKQGLMEKKNRLMRKLEELYVRVDELWKILQSLINAGEALNNEKTTHLAAKLREEFGG